MFELMLYVRLGMRVWMCIVNLGCVFELVLYVELGMCMWMRILNLGCVCLNK